jgi:hypothetical protein
MLWIELQDLSDETWREGLAKKNKTKKKSAKKEGKCPKTGVP